MKIKNFPAQEEIFSSPARYIVVVKGRRFGLTKGACNDFMKCALNKEFRAGLWVDTVNANIDRYVERYFLPELNKLPRNLWSWHKQSRVLKIMDSYIDFRSADRPENLEGFGYDKAFLNEAGIILKSSYLWNNAIRPMLWEFRPKTVIGGTPKVGSLTFRELAERGKDTSQSEYAYFKFTSFDNPYLDREALEKEIASMPENVKKQEVYAEFLDDSGVVFRNIESVMKSHPERPQSGHLYVMGVDLAKVQDWTVITIYDRTGNNQVYQDRFQTIDWVFQKKRISTIAKMYNNALVRIDATGVGDPIADDLIREGLAIEPVKFTNESKKQMIEKMVLFTEQGQCSLINLPESVSEFNSFTYDVSTSGRIIYNAPQGFNDDIVWSHCLAVSGLFPLLPEDKKKDTTLIQKAYEWQIQHGDDSMLEYDIIEG